MAGRKQPPTSAPGMKAQRLVINASHIAVTHTYLALAAFGLALFLGCALHYEKIVKNGVAGYPDEWFPSVSATIGDWYPERNIFQILIALTSGPRFALVSLQYFVRRSPSTSWPGFLFAVGIIRTLMCGGWVYITSNDDHDMHDLLMITYILCNVPWMWGGVLCTPFGHVKARQQRRYLATGFFVLIIPMIYFFVQHKIYRIPGAYTRYSFFEWSLILLDVLFDSITELDFKTSNLQIVLSVSLDAKVGRDDISHSAPSKGSDSVTETKLEGSAASSETKQMASHVSGAVPRTFFQKIQAALTLSLDARAAIGFISDVYLSYLFWSIFTSLITTLFYFSVWQLALSGSELSLLCLLSPALSGIRPLRTWALTRSGRVTLKAVAILTGLGSYILNSPMRRLFMVNFANVVLLIGQTVDWSAGKDGYQGLLLGLGLVLLSLAKHANHSTNPVWPMLNEQSGGYNKTGLFLALCALYELATRPKVTSHGWLAGSIALGSMIFTLHCFFIDPSTIIAWSWTGYKNSQPKGPLPHLHGSLTLIAQAIGLAMPTILPAYWLSSPLWFSYGCASAFMMYRFRDWTGFVGGLNLAVFVMSLLPRIIQQSAQPTKAGRTYFTAFFVTVLFYLADVWTVAYAFVPGGPYLRERSDLVLITQFVATSLIFEWPSRKRTAANTIVHMPSSASSLARCLLTLFSLSAVLVTIYRWTPVGPRPYKSGTGIINAGIWTVHFGIDNIGHDSQRLIRDIIRDMELDVVGLLETDLHVIALQDLGYYVDLGPGPNMHTWGAALLSKFPIVHSQHHLLPSPHGELAPAIEAVLDVYGTEVTVVVSHNGQEQDPLDRELQSMDLARIMAKSYPQPVIFLGYVVTKPHAGRPAPYEILVHDGIVHDIDPQDWDRWCEYILYRGLYRTAYARVSRGIVTDTELQIGQFVVPRHGFQLVNQTLEDRMLRAWKEDLPEDHWFPMEYYGNEDEGGMNGHFYHVFNTVRLHPVADTSHILIL
ncbi:Frag1/DRAM/Sfk1 family-domain-containing protein [Suillus subaureus]|uniref:Frag1/DRAM/Sfk1 family-domain-containing protein n=1 Tax=Suillus subaureus TaxID=48587 RepID=A0A9P7JH75_9AGAM|nr:Frag1/DRAM/Sfk1 family-domain-containing protein [Suillus subaureus]KAG1821921.1 Frag1/DRAM/Sfk1 family-domain-containing protein [Suillus subaureus]